MDAGAWVVDAIRCINNPATSNEERLRSTRLLEELKQDKAKCLQLGFQVASNASADPTVRHFGLHCVENVVGSWESLKEEEKSFLKYHSLELANHAKAPRDPLFVREKVAALVTKIALHEWPERWPDLLTHLFQLAAAEASQMQMTLMVLRDLSDEVTAFNPRLSSQRRKKLQTSLEASLDTIFPLCKSALTLQQACGAVVSTALECLVSLLEWTQAKCIFAHGFLPIFCGMMQQPEYCLRVAELLHSMVEHKAAHIPSQFHSQLPVLWNQLVQLTVQLMPIQFENKILTLSKLVQVLATLTKNFAGMLSPSPDTPQFQALRAQFISLLGQLFAHPSLKLSLASLQIWVNIFRSTGTHILKADLRTDVISKLFEVCTMQMTKTSTSKPSPEDEFDTIEHYHHHYSAFRHANMVLMEHLAKVCPSLCLEMTLARYSQFASIGFETQRQTFEASGTVLDAVMRSIPEKHFSPALSKGDQKKIGPLANQVLTILSKCSSVDPLTQTARLQQFAFFSPLFIHNPEAIQMALDQILIAVNFGNAGNVPADRLPELVLQTRLTACRVLVTIAKKVPVLPVDILIKRVLELMNVVSQREKIALFEFLVIATKSAADAGMQTKFVMEILREPMGQWTSQGLQQLLSDPRKVLELVGMSTKEQQELREGQTVLGPTSLLASDHPRAWRERIVRMVNICVAVFDAICCDQSTTGPQGGGTLVQAASMLGQALPTIFRLLSAIMALWLPEARTLVPAHMQPIFAQTLAHIDLYLGPNPKAREGLVYDCWKWISASSTGTLKLLAMAVRAMGPAFFQACPAQQLLAHSVQHCSYISHRQIFHMLEDFVVPFASTCPPEHMESHLEPVLLRLMGLVLGRLTDAWQQATAGPGQVRTGGDRNDQEEVLDDVQLQELTRTFSGMWLKIVRPPQAGRNPNKKRAQAAPNSDSRPDTGPLTVAGRFMLSREQLSQPLLSCAEACLRWPDSNARRKAVLLCGVLIPVVAERQEFHQSFGRILMTVLQAVGRLQEVDLAVAAGGGDGDMVALVTDIYTHFGKFSTMARDSILSFMAASAIQLPTQNQDLQNLESMLVDPACDHRTHRKAVKAFLVAHVVGKRCTE